MVGPAVHQPNNPTAGLWVCQFGCCCAVGPVVCLPAHLVAGLPGLLCSALVFSLAWATRASPPLALSHLNCSLALPPAAKHKYRHGPSTPPLGTYSLPQPCGATVGIYQPQPALFVRLVPPGAASTATQAFVASCTAAAHYLATPGGPKPPTSPQKLAPPAPANARLAAFAHPWSLPY